MAEPGASSAAAGSASSAARAERVAAAAARRGQCRLRSFAVGQPDVVDRMLDTQRPPGSLQTSSPRKSASPRPGQGDPAHLDEGVGIGSFRRRARVAGLRLHPQGAELHGSSPMSTSRAARSPACGDLVEVGKHRLLVDDLLCRAARPRSHRRAAPRRWPLCRGRALRLR